MAVTFILGGDSANELFAGCFTEGGDATFANSQGADGAALYSADDIADDEITDNGATITIAHTGIDASGSVKVGHWAYIEWDGGDYVDDRYEITAVSTDSITIDYAGGSDPPDITEDETKIRIGGAVKEGAASDATHILDIMQLAIAGDTIKVQGNLSTDRILSITADGTAAAPIILRGVNSSTGNSLTLGDTLPVITAAGVIDEIIDGTGDQWRIEFIECDGDNKAVNCIEWSNAGTYCQLSDLRLHNATAVGLVWYSAYSHIDNCEIDNNGSHGATTAYNYITLTNCDIHDNTGGGIYTYSHGVNVLDTLIYDNIGIGIAAGQDGINFGTIANCTIDGNSDGIYIQTSCIAWSIFNNIISNHDAGGKFGIRWESAGTEDQQQVITHNTAYNNDTNTNEGTWATLGSGENFTYNPNFDANYKPQNLEVWRGAKPDVQGNQSYMGAVRPHVGGGGLVNGGLV